jgi:hypothetical protein
MLSGQKKMKMEINHGAAMPAERARGIARSIQLPAAKRSGDVGCSRFRFLGEDIRSAKKGTTSAPLG